MNLQLTYSCPKGHDSTEADFCSECGAKILGITPVLDLTANDSASNNQQICPDCATPHNTDEGPFCEICGYNFVTGISGDTVLPPPPLPTFSPPTQWELQIAIDPSLRLPESPDPPDLPQQTIALEKPTTLMGRTSQARAIYPDVSLDFDDAISHRHAIFSLQPDGSLMLRDIGSSNGTLLNGVELKPMTDVPLKSGDSIVLGHWTRIFVRS